MSTDTLKTIFVIGATGAQGIAVVKALLAPTQDGNPSPWRVRALSRNLAHQRVQHLQGLGVEFIEGSFMDWNAVSRGMKGAYGAFVNTDGFTIGAQAEVYAGIRIYEIAQRERARHFVWSSLDYISKKANWDPLYATDHYDGKGIVAEFLSSQPVNLEEGTMWTVFTNGPYMDMLQIGMFVPLNVRLDGNVVFALPLGDGLIPMITLKDLGWWARHIFDSPHTTAGKNLEVASQMVGFDDIVETFTRVTGRPAIAVRQEVDEHLEVFDGIDHPLNNNSPTTFRTNFGGWWRTWRDTKIVRDMDSIRHIHPGTQSLEQWMREVNYDGSFSNGLKSMEDMSGWNVTRNMEKMAQL